MKILSLFLLLAVSPVLSPAQPIRVNGIAAKANGGVITMNELMIRLAPIQSVLMAQYPRRGAIYNEVLKTQRDKILDELIDSTIIYTEYADRLQNIPDQAIEDEVQRHIDNVYAGDEKEFRKYLQATNLTRAQFKEQQRKQIVVQAVRSKQFPDLPPPTQQELKAEYADWKIKNRDRKKDVGTYQKIYLRSGFDREEAISLGERIVAELKKGADFSELAKEHSADSKAKTGGLWKDVPRTDLNREFGFIVFDSEKDGIIGPIEGPGGITIFKVLDRKLGPAEPLSKVKPQLVKLINSKKKAAAFDQWMAKLRARVPVQKNI